MYEPVSEEMRAMKGPDERIHWFGRPDKRCFVFECIFNPMLPFSIVWAAFDAFMLFGMDLAKVMGGGDWKQLAFVCAFFALHLMPVWLYLGGILFSCRKYGNTEYMITDRGVYVSGGIWSKRIRMQPLDKISCLSVRRGFFDRRCGAGDVILSEQTLGQLKQTETLSNITDIHDYKEVFQLIKQLRPDCEV